MVFVNFKKFVYSYYHIISLFFVITNLGLIVEGRSPNSEKLSRYPRYLVYPPRAAYKLVLGLGIPANIEVKGKYLSWGYNFQFQYTLPINFTQLKLPSEFREARHTGPGHSLRVIDRTAVYLLLEDYMEGKGLPGRECLLLSICEAAAYPLQHDGLLGLLMQIVLSPHMGEMGCTEHVEARLLGERGVSCRAAFPACPVSVLDQISILT